MRQRLAWFTTAPLMLGGLLAGHALGYRLAIVDPHARADALAHSGHGYFGYLPFALSVCLGVLVAALVLQGVTGFRGERRRPATSPLILLLPPIAFVVQEFLERFIHSGHIPWTTVFEPAFLFGLALPASVRIGRAPARVGAGLSRTRGRASAGHSAPADLLGLCPRSRARRRRSAPRRPRARLRRTRAALPSLTVVSVGRARAASSEGAV